MGTTINGNDVIAPGKLTIGTFRMLTAAAGQTLISDGNGNMTPQSPALVGLTGGTKALSAGSDTGSVTGLGLGHTPSQILITVRSLAGADKIFANVVDGSITTDGFNYELSAIPPDGTYKLDYLVI